MIGLLVTLILFPLVGWSLGRRSLGEAFLFGAGLTGSVLFLAGVVHVPLVVALGLVGMWGVGSGVWELMRRSRPTRLPGCQVAGLPKDLQPETSQPETPRRGNEETGQSGNEATLQLGNPATRQPGNPTTQQPNNPATQQPSTPLPPPTPHAPLPTILMLIPIVALAFVAAITPLSDFDGRAFWVLKAKAIAQERTIDGPFFRGVSVDPRKNHYPILIPIDGAVIFGIAHDVDDRQIRWLYLGVLAALALLVRERIGSLVSPAAGAWCAALLLWIPQFAIEPEGGALSAYNDIAVAAFAAGAFFELIAADSPLRFGLWLTFLLLTKSEGLPFALVLLAVGTYVFRKRIAVPAIVSGIAALALTVWRMRIPAGDEEDIIRLLPTIPEKLHRIGEALAAFPSHMLLLPRWGAFWIAVVVASVLSLRLDRRAALLAIAVISAMLGIYVTVYVATAWVPSDLIAVTADRLLMHLIAPSLFLLALGARAAEGSGRIVD